ncbi:NUMOD3 domain-containing DNA-binding protein [Bacillus cereus group sp. BceL305]|uniref:NUMOD3 domain-containing DNA-binding protein n=1 Tax=Bacillus cereus group sp. BceL305 TaxID=3444980 RepID=UPI003F1EE59A
MGREKIIGVYAILNLNNGKVYIGSSVDVFKRWGDHTRELERGNHHSPRLQNSWDKHGEDAFSFEIIDDVGDKDRLIKQEQYWIDIFKSYDDSNGYNISHAAKSCLGIERSEEFKEGCRWRNLGKKQSEETRQKRSESLKEFYKHNKRKVSFKTRMLMSIRMRGNIPSEETRRKLSEAGKGRVGSFAGKKLSEEHRRKLSESRRGEKHFNFGKEFSDELRKKLSDAHKGIKLSEESIKKLKVTMAEREVNKGSKNGMAKLDEDKVREIKRLLKEGVGIMDIAEKFNVSRQTISGIKNGRRWAHIKL